MTRSLLRLSVFVPLVACDPSQSRPPRDDEPSRSDEVTYYEGTGTVAELLETHVRIEHDAIPGFMDAMTMSFEVADPSLLADIEPGMDVTFRIVVESSSAVIDRIARGERPR